MSRDRPNAPDSWIVRGWSAYVLSCLSLDVTSMPTDRPDPVPARSPVRLIAPHSSSPDVNAGERITRGKYEVRSEVNSGTAGLIVVDQASSAHRYVLTCAHVLGPQAALSGQQLLDANVVYSPELSRCSGFACSNPIGQVVPTTLPPRPGGKIQRLTKINNVQFAVDAALIQLDPSAKASNDVPKIGLITTVRDLIAEWNLQPGTSLTLSNAQQIAVRKFGAVTGLRHGHIVGLAMETVVRPDQPDTPAMVMEIDAAAQAGDPPFTGEWELDMEAFDVQDAITDPQQVLNKITSNLVTATIGGSATAPTLKVTGRVFSLPGDSGSPIVDDSGKVVGILTGGKFDRIYVKGHQSIDIPSGRSQAIFVRAALDELKVALLPMAQNNAGPPLARPGIAIMRAPRDGVDPAALRRATAAVERTAAGSHVGGLVRRHFDEVRDLVHHRRRVLVTWHRHKGPGFVNAFIKASGRPGWPVPREVAGVALTDAIRAMRDVLLAEGSPSLRAAITEHEHEILALALRAGSLTDVLRDWAPAPAVRLVNSRGVPGTAAATVRDGTGTRFLLTNYHVAFGDGAPAGEPVWAVPEPDSLADGVVLGPTRRGEIGRVSVDGRIGFVDCALVELGSDPLPAWLRDCLDVTRRPGPAAVSVGSTVVKHGPTTGTTLGVVLDADHQDRPVIGGHTFHAVGQLLIGSQETQLNFSAAGDSGAAVLDDEGFIVGLLWGSNALGEGMASPIAAVLDCLGVTLEPALAPRLVLVPGLGGLVAAEEGWAT
jgi:hypothetical protein